MKKLIIYLVPIIFITAFTAAFAEEDGWESIYNSYGEAQYEKPVSEKEFQNAVQTIEKFQKKDKKKKSKNENPKPKEFILSIDVPSRREPLLMLANNVNYNGRVIPQGFYLVSAINKNNKHFIRLSQGEGKIIADIEADYLKSENTENKIFSQIVEDDILKLTYTDKDLILEAYLWIQ